MIATISHVGMQVEYKDTLPPLKMGQFLPSLNHCQMQRKWMALFKALGDRSFLEMEHKARLEFSGISGRTKVHR